MKITVNGILLDIRSTSISLLVIQPTFVKLCRVECTALLWHRNGLTTLSSVYVSNEIQTRGVSRSLPRVIIRIVLAALTILAPFCILASFGFCSVYCKRYALFAWQRYALFAWQRYDLFAWQRRWLVRVWYWSDRGACRMYGIVVVGVVMKFISWRYCV